MRSITKEMWFNTWCIVFYRHFGGTFCREVRGLSVPHQDTHGYRTCFNSKRPPRFFFYGFWSMELLFLHTCVGLPLYPLVHKLYRYHAPRGGQAFLHPCWFMEGNETLYPQRGSPPGAWFCYRQVLGYNGILAATAGRNSLSQLFYLEVDV